MAAYNVSGEYSMVKAAARAWLVDGKRVAFETLPESDAPEPTWS